MVKIAHINAAGIVVNITLGTTAPETGELDAFGNTLAVCMDGQIGDRHLDGQYITPPPPLPTEAELIAAVQAHLDAQAQARGYDNILSVCSYAGAPNPFQTEAQAFIAWRGAVWESCFAYQAEVQSGTRQPPTVDQLIAALPVMSAA